MREANAEAKANPRTSRSRDAEDDRPENDNELALPRIGKQHQQQPRQSEDDEDDEDL